MALGILIALGVAVILLGWVIATFNRFAHLRNLVLESWSDVDVALKRRHDLIPNLVETVKGYAAHEQNVLQRVTELRAQAVQTHAGIDRIALGEAALVST